MKNHNRKTLTLLTTSLFSALILGTVQIRVAKADSTDPVVGTPTTNTVQPTSTESSNITTASQPSSTSSTSSETPETDTTATENTAATANQSQTATTTATHALPLAKTARLAPPAPAPVSSQASTITFHYVDASTGEPITFNGNWASLPDLHGKGDVSSYTLTNTSSDPTMTIPGKTQYATTIPGYQYIGDANLDIPNQFAAGNLDVTLNYLSLAAVNVAYVDAADPKTILWHYTIPATDVAKGDPYKTDYYQVPFNGYHFTSAVGATSGTFGQTNNLDGTENPITITYYYQKDANGDTTSTPIGSSLHAFQTETALSSNSTSSGTPTATTKAGYTLIASATSQSGATSYSQYLANAQVTVNYVDQDTQAILATTTLGTEDASNNIFPSGTYQTSARTFTDYQLTNISGATSGTYDPIARTVTYYYHKASQTVTAPPADDTPVEVPAEVSYVTPSGSLIDVNFIKGRPDVLVKPLIYPKLTQFHQQGYVIISSEITATTQLQPLASYRIILTKLTQPLSPFQQPDMPAMARLRNLTAKPILVPTRLTATPTMPSSVHWDARFISANQGIDNINVVTEKDLSHLSRWLDPKGSGSDDVSTLAAYFISLNGKINFGEL
ncbi:MucBP domain-containing protein [Secundilactobacillus odoratitofui]|nr:MucBP domain-containing protein [Secundilactobacillus odoratitofui]